MSDSDVLVKLLTLNIVDLPTVVTKPGHSSEEGEAARQRQHDVITDARTRGTSSGGRGTWSQHGGRGVDHLSHHQHSLVISFTVLFEHYKQLFGSIQFKKSPDHIKSCFLV